MPTFISYMRDVSENHSRAFNAIASLTEKKLLDIESLIAKYERNDAVIVILNNDVPGEVLNEVRKAIAEIRQTLVRFGLEYNLPGDKRSLKREVNVVSSFLWEDLAGAADHKFKGYGDIDADVLAEVEGYLARMIDKTRVIMSLTS